MNPTYTFEFTQSESAPSDANCCSNQSGFMSYSYLNSSNQRGPHMALTFALTNFNSLQLHIYQPKKEGSKWLGLSVRLYKSL